MQAVAATAAAGMPPIAVSAPQGQLLALLARMAGARQVLELGTLGGYSTIWLARALPAGGRLISLEVDPRHAEVARANLAAAGVESIVEVRVGAALDTLPKLVEEGAGPFDLIFIDADKPNIPEYVDLVAQAVQTGHRARGGQRGPRRRAHRRQRVPGPKWWVSGACTSSWRRTDRVAATTIQTVGSKGYDGFTLAVVNSL